MELYQVAESLLGKTTAAEAASNGRDALVKNIAVLVSEDCKYTASEIADYILSCC